MWMQAATSIKLVKAAGKGARVVTELDSPFETDETTGAELLKLGAATQVDAPAAEPASAPATKSAAKK